MGMYRSSLAISLGCQAEQLTIKAKTYSCSCMFHTGIGKVLNAAWGMVNYLVAPGANPKDKLISYLWCSTSCLTCRGEELGSALRGLTSVAWLTIQRHEQENCYKI